MIRFFLSIPLMAMQCSEYQLDGEDEPGSPLPADSGLDWPPPQDTQEPASELPPVPRDSSVPPGCCTVSGTRSSTTTAMRAVS